MDWRFSVDNGMQEREHSWGKGFPAFVADSLLLSHFLKDKLQLGDQLGRVRKGSAGVHANKWSDHGGHIKDVFGDRGSLQSATLEGVTGG